MKPRNHYEAEEMSLRGACGEVLLAQYLKLKQLNAWRQISHSVPRSRAASLVIFAAASDK